MVCFEYLGKGYVAREQESFLECLLRHGVDINHSCKNGVCNACLSKCYEPPLDLYTGALPKSLVEKGYFLPCRTVAEDGISFGLPEARDIALQSELVDKILLAEDVWQFTFAPFQSFDYQPGQFVYIYNELGEGRPYSIASSPFETPYLEFHVKHIPNGLVSDWLVKFVDIGDVVDVSPPGGDCYLKESMEDIYLIAFGVGMSSVYGVLQAAAYYNTLGQYRNIKVYHIANKKDGFYLSGCIRRWLEGDHRVQYLELIYEDVGEDLVGLLDYVLEPFAGRSEPHYFLCGSPGNVKTFSSLLEEQGVSSANILSDPYESVEASGINNDFQLNSGEDIDWDSPELPYPETSPELWHELGEGRLLKQILDEFYDRVYEDPIMSPYFQHFTKQRSKEKVYSFYRQIFTGEKVFFGDRPKNAHSWMVINDDVYDYRIRLLVSCMRNNGLSENAVQLWLPYEEYYRKDIVKRSPKGRKVGNMTQPEGGFGRETLDEGSVCDACEGFVEKGDEVIYNLRTGQIYCPDCHQP